LFSTKGKKDLDPSLMAKSKKGDKAANTKVAERQRDIAHLEAQVYR